MFTGRQQTLPRRLPDEAVSAKPQLQVTLSNIARRNCLNLLSARCVAWGDFYAVVYTECYITTYNIDSKVLALRRSPTLSATQLRRGHGFNKSRWTRQSDCECLRFVCPRDFCNFIVDIKMFAAWKPKLKKKRRSNLR